MGADSSETAGVAALASRGWSTAVVGSRARISLVSRARPCWELSTIPSHDCTERASVCSIARGAELSCSSFGCSATCEAPFSDSRRSASSHLARLHQGTTPPRRLVRILHHHPPQLQHHKRDGWHTLTAAHAPFDRGPLLAPTRSKSTPRAPAVPASAHALRRAFAAESDSALPSGSTIHMAVERGT